MLSPVGAAAKIVFLTGAGASVALGLPDTKQFLDSFFIEEEPRLAAADADLLPYLEDLRVLAVNGLWDAEKLIDVLDGDRTAADRLMAQPHFVSRVLAGNPLLFGPFVAQTDTILQAVKDKVVEAYTEVDPFDAARLYRPILQSFPDWFAEIPELGTTLLFFTLNYDLAIEAAASLLQGPDPKNFPGRAVRLIDGLVHDEPGATGPRWSRRAFEEFQEDPGKANVVLVKLHGSVRWGQGAADEIVQLADGVGRDPGRFQTLILYPTEGPKPIAAEPFHTAYRLFRASLGHARLLVAIGTSFRDAELVQELCDAVEDNPGLHVVTVGPSQKHDALARRLGVPTRRVAALQAEFTFPAQGTYDPPGQATASSLMEALREFALTVYDVRHHPGSVAFGSTYLLNAKGRWQEVAG